MPQNGAVGAGQVPASPAIPGCAMRAPNSPQPRTLVGNAMRAFDRDGDEIEMLVMLR